MHMTASVHAIALGTSFDIYTGQNRERICLAGLLLYTYLSAEKYQSAVRPNVTQHMH